LANKTNQKKATKKVYIKKKIEKIAKICGRNATTTRATTTTTTDKFVVVVARLQLKCLPFCVVPFAHFFYYG